MSDLILNYSLEPLAKGGRSGGTKWGNLTVHNDDELRGLVERAYQAYCCGATTRDLAADLQMNRTFMLRLWGKWVTERGGPSLLRLWRAAKPQRLAYWLRLITQQGYSRVKLGSDAIKCRSLTHALYRQGLLLTVLARDIADPNFCNLSAFRRGLILQQKELLERNSNGDSLAVLAKEAGTSRAAVHARLSGYNVEARTEASNVTK